MCWANVVPIPLTMPAHNDSCTRVRSTNVLRHDMFISMTMVCVDRMRVVQVIFLFK